MLYLWADRKGWKGDAVMSLSTVVYHQPGKAIDLCFHCSLSITMFIYEVFVLSVKPLYSTHDMRLLCLLGHFKEP